MKKQQDTSITKPTRIHVDTELRDLLPPLSDEARTALEASIVAHGGARDPIVVWAGNGAILDGHNRFEICEKLGLPYNTQGITIADKQSAKQWMFDSQTSKRNLSVDQQIALAVLRGLEVPPQHRGLVIAHEARTLDEASLLLVLHGERTLRQVTNVARRKAGVVAERAPNRTPLEIAVYRMRMLSQEDLLRFKKLVDKQVKGEAK